MTLRILKVLELTVHLTKALTSVLYHVVIYYYRVLLVVGGKHNLVRVGLSYHLTHHLLTQDRRRNSKDGSTVFLYTT